MAATLASATKTAATKSTATVAAAETAAATSAAFAAGTTATRAATAWNLSCRCLATLPIWHNAFALGLLASQFTGATNCFSLLAHALLGRLLKVVPELHLTENAFALQLLLQRFKGLVDIIVTDLDEHPGKPRFVVDENAPATAGQIV